MKKNQERRLHRKNAKIVKEGGTPMQLNRPVKPDTTVNTTFSFFFPFFFFADKLTIPFFKNNNYRDDAVIVVRWDT
jgi:hypothetical protein